MQEDESVAIDIFKIHHISSEDNYISLTHEIQKTWYNKHLTYQNLEKNRENPIFDDDKTMLWTPFYSYINTKDGEKCKRTDLPEKYIVIPNNNLNHTKNSYTDSLNAFHYKGSEHMLQQTLGWTCDWICELKIVL